MRMFIASLFERATNWKLPKCSLIVEWINKKAEFVKTKYSIIGKNNYYYPQQYG